MARTLRISAEMHDFVMKLAPALRRPLVQRIQRDLEDNFVDASLVLAEDDAHLDEIL